jgi:hypothetical protein
LTLVVIFFPVKESLVANFVNCQFLVQVVGLACVLRTCDHEMLRSLNITLFFWSQLRHSFVVFLIEVWEFRRPCFRIDDLGARGVLPKRCTLRLSTQALHGLLAGYLFLKVGHCFAHKSRLQRTWLLPKFVAADLTLALSFLDFTFGLGKQLVFRIS